MRNKSTIIILIVILSLLVLFLVGGMIYLLVGNHKLPIFFKGDYHISKELILEENYSLEDSIKIESDAADIEIKNWENDTIKVLVYGEKETTKVSENNQQLNIHLKGKKCVGFCFLKTISRVEIYVPKYYENRISIINSFGDVKIEKLLKTNIDIHTSFGDVFVSGANKIEVENNLGDIEIGYAEELEVKASAGDIKIDEAKNITAINNLGDIEIKKALDYINLSVDCGNVEIDELFLTQNSSIENNLGDIEINHTNEIYIDAKTDLGSVDVKNNMPSSSVRLGIKNNCGDIEVND